MKKDADGEERSGAPVPEEEITRRQAIRRIAAVVGTSAALSIGAVLQGCATDGGPSRPAGGYYSISYYSNKAYSSYFSYYTYKSYYTERYSSSYTSYSSRTYYFSTYYSQAPYRR